MANTDSDLDILLSSRARKLARLVLEAADADGLTIATAESCTGGLLSTLLTDVSGLSHCVECGFVVYSDESKRRLLGVPVDMLDTYGAVSRDVAIEMAEQAVQRGQVDVALAITGFAGPAGPGDEEGLVHFAVAGPGLAAVHRATAQRATIHKECHFGPLGRHAIRARALETGLLLLNDALRS